MDINTIDPVIFAKSLANDLSSDYGPNIAEEVEAEAMSNQGTRDIGSALEIAGQIATISALIWEISKLVWARWKVVNNDDKLRREIHGLLSGQNVVNDAELESIIDRAIKKASASRQ